MFTVHARMLIVQHLTICNFHAFLLSIDKMKENNQHNKLLNETKMTLNLYSTISLSNITNVLWLHCIIILKLKVERSMKLMSKHSKFKESVVVGFGHFDRPKTNQIFKKNGSI